MDPKIDLEYLRIEIGPVEEHGFRAHVKGTKPQGMYCSLFVF